MDQKHTITLFIITKNEASHIATCIRSAKNLVQDIVVLDSFSTDNTVQICRDLGARVYQQPFENFTKQKNDALAKVTTEWALSLDADETLTAELAEEIRQAVSNPDYDGYKLPRVNNFLGRRMYQAALKKNIFYG